MSDPKKIHIEYCTAWGYESRFKELKQALEKNFSVTVEGNAKGKSRPSSFEVTDEEGNCLYSKLSTGKFPKADAVVKSIKDTGRF